MAKAARPAAPPAPKGQTYMILTMMIMLFVMVDPSLSQALGAGMSVLLNPTIGFAGQLPVISIFFAGALTGLFSTGLRHWSSDYIALERGRILQRTFSKDLNDARMKRDVDRVDRLRRAQPFVMSHTMEANYATMKPAVGTMIVALAVFGWMRVFLATQVRVSGVSLPWTPSWPLGGSFGFPNYILLYMVMSLPLTLAIGAGLRLWRYRAFDPAAPLKPLPTVEDLVRRAEGDVDDEELVRRESERAKRRLKGGARGPAPSEPAGQEGDDEEDATSIVEGDEAQVKIVDPDGEGDAAGAAAGEAGAAAAPGKRARGALTARAVDAAASSGTAPSEEE